MRGRLDRWAGGTGGICQPTSGIWPVAVRESGSLLNKTRLLPGPWPCILFPADLKAA